MSRARRGVTVHRLVLTKNRNAETKHRAGPGRLEAERVWGTWTRIREDRHGPDRRRAGRLVQSGRTSLFPVPVLRTFTRGRAVTFIKPLNCSIRYDTSGNAAVKGKETRTATAVAGSARPLRRSMADSDRRTVPLTVPRLRPGLNSDCAETWESRVWPGKAPPRQGWGRQRSYPDSDTGKEATRARGAPLYLRPPSPRPRGSLAKPDSGAAGLENLAKGRGQSGALTPLAASLSRSSAASAWAT